MDKADLPAALAAAGLARVSGDIERLARNSIRLRGQIVDEATLPIGASKLGGAPDLPPGMPWPQWRDLPQSFIAQIRLADVAASDLEHQLPSLGMLWFFYDARQQTFGADPTDRGGWQVVQSAVELAQLTRAPVPPTLPTAGRFATQAITASAEVTLPLQPQLEMPSLSLTADEQSRYEQLLASFPTAADHATPHHRLLGDPETLQDDMRSACAILAHGVPLDDARAAVLAKGALDWQLLLQIDSDEHAGMRWSNAGLLYYWIERDALSAQRFDNTWLMLQSE